MPGKIREYKVPANPKKGMQISPPVLWVREMRDRGIQKIELLRDGDTLIIKPAQEDNDH